MAEMALSVVLSLPERMSCRVPGTAGPFQLFILSNWCFRRRGNAARVCAAAGEFFGLILFAQDIIALLRRQIAAAQLFFADPDDRLMAVCKVLFQNGVLDFGVLP